MEMAWSLKPIAALLPWHRKPSHAAELYGAIVARARLPVFYQWFEVPDTLEGRFVVLSLHLFVLLHRLKDGGAQAAPMAQELADHFSADMETVLRELGVGDLAIPKKVRRLAASGAALLQDYEDALTKGDGALAASIAYALPLDEASAKLASESLTSYLMEVIRHLDAQPVADLCAGRLSLPEPELLRALGDKSERDGQRC
jgi:cytochrome b pre-mRNA-processing protein 3